MSIKLTPKTVFGLTAEGVVCDHLKTSGHRILDRNWRKPWGELDIVSEKDRVVHFVEVKASRLAVAGFQPFLRANGSKMHKVMRTAQTWLSAHNYPAETEWQLDIASVIMASGGTEIELFENI